MPRIARAVFKGHPHHVMQRGNYRQSVFHDDADRARYLEYLAEYKEKYGLLVWAWCLMDDHVHLVCVPKGPESLSRTLHSTHMRYANYLNRRYGQQGHLWQGRFFSCALDGEHVGNAIRYVERNAVRARIVRYAENYRWSSARGRVSGKSDQVVDAGLSAGGVTGGMRGGWKAWLRLGDDGDEAESLRSCTRTGRPLGSKAFVTKMERLAGRRLHALKHGRPSKKRKP